ncbi:troponin C-like isoform X1 [Styela clava]
MTHNEIDLQPIMKSIYDVFAAFDKDQSETLELSELMNLLRACNINVSKSECEVILHEMDSNNDGVMDFGEFMSFLGMIYKIRFSKRTKLKDEFQRKLKSRQSSNKSVLRKVSQNKGPRPSPPPRKSSVVQTSTKTR